MAVCKIIVFKTVQFARLQATNNSAKDEKKTNLKRCEERCKEKCEEKKKGREVFVERKEKGVMKNVKR